MKLIILTLLLSVAVQAQIKLKIVHDNLEHGSSMREFPTVEEAETHLVSILENSHWMEGEWNSTASNIAKVVGGVTVYFHPSNFTHTIRDKTLNPTQNEIDEDARAVEVTAVRAMAANITASDKPVWEKKLLKRLIKELR